MTMRIALDCRMQEGVGAVIRNVAVRIAPRLERLVLLGDPDRIRRWAPAARNVEIVPFLAPVYGWREQVEFPMSRIASCHLLHVPHFNIPLRPSPCPLICSIHDVAHLAGVLPASAAYRLAARLYYTHAVKRSAHIITGSEFSRAEIISRLGVSPDRITVIPDGVDPHAFRRPTRKKMVSLMSRFGIRQRYLLVLGSVRPHKNVGRVLRAFEVLKTRHAVPHQLVIVGRREGFRINEDLPALPEGVGGDVVFTGFLPDEDVSALYSYAEVFIFASTYEGFGLPPLEAMACGTPVAVSRVASLPEVVGDAGAYFDPLDTNDIARVVLDLVKSPSRRAALSRKGKARARVLTWDKTAEGHLKVYADYAR